jgi:hypothetical protein
MRTATKVILGVVPACLMTTGGLLFSGFIATAYQWSLLAAAMIGTAGLIWSLTNYPHKIALLVLVSLLVGIVGILVGGLGGAASAFAIDVHNGRVGSPVVLVLRMLLIGWLVIGPIAVAIIQARHSLLRLRAAA